MDKTIQIHGKTIQVHLTKRALKALESSSEPVYAEIQLFFSCMIRKRLLFSKLVHENAVPITDGLRIYFHAVMSDSCSLDDYERISDLPLTDFPIKRQEAFVPRWVSIDFKKNQWIGDFGYINS